MPLRNQQPASERPSGFTLIELLVVVGIMVALMVMITPAVTGMKGSGDINKAAYDMAGAVQCARSYARANNTYVWLGFFEENMTSMAAPVPAKSGTGRIVLSIVASKDGTAIYDPAQLPVSRTTMTAGLSQINKLVKINGVHLKTAGTSSAFPIGDGTGMTFPTRPYLNTKALWQVGDTLLQSKSSQAPFQYPVGSPAPTANYTFTTAIQFNPRGEARVNDASQPLQQIIEIGLQPTHGAVVDATNKNVVAVQITGITGDVKIYKR